MRKAHASVQQMPIGVQRGLFDAEGVFPAAAIAFAGTSDAAVVFRPSAFRSRGSWTFATVPPATLPQDDLALLRSMFLAPVVFEMCCRHDSTQICGANSILRLSRQSICHSAAEVVSETPTIGRSWSKSLEPEWHARPSPYFATFASTACRKRHPSPKSGTHLRKCASHPLRVLPISPALTHALPQVRVTIPSAGLRIVPISHRRGNRNSRKGTKWIRWLI